jgi:hypothetical protein
MKEKELPIESDFIVYGDLDEISACQNFLGKTKLEAKEMLISDFLRYQEDFMFMGPVAFNFYIDCLIDALKKDFSVDNALAFCRLCEYRLGDKLFDQLKPSVPLVVESFDWLIDRIDSGDADILNFIKHVRHGYDAEAN